MAQNTRTPRQFAAGIDLLVAATYLLGAISTPVFFCASFFMTFATLFGGTPFSVPIEWKVVWILLMVANMAYLTFLVATITSPYQRRQCGSLSWLLTLFALLALWGFNLATLWFWFTWAAPFKQYN